MILIYFCLLLGLTLGFDDEGCPDNWFDCKNGKCVSSFFVCDGEDECGNEMDEIGCEGTNKKFEAYKCPTHHYKCEQSHLCVPNKWICDGHKDCPQKDDERNCTRAKSSCEGFVCHNMQCIPKRWHCDGSTDCEDGSDELGCDAGKVQKLCGLANGYYQCLTGQCINKTKVCDGHRDCPKGDDEGESCHDDRCATHGCSQTCINTPLGARCLCQEGYKISSDDDKQCVDRDECAEGPQHMCSHLCTDLPGSYRCFCHDGYELEKDNRTCRAKGSSPILYFTDSFSIRSFDLRHNRYSRIRRASSKALGIDVFVQDELLFWAEYDTKHAVIYSSDTKGNDLKPLIAVGLRKPDGVAFDWVTRNLYIADVELHVLLVCTFSGEFCKVLVNDQHALFRSILVSPRRGLMYWTDWGSSNPGIYSAYMDGTNKKRIVTNDIKWPNALTLDETSNRLYWTDGKKKTVEYYDIYSTYRKVIVPGGVYNPFAIALFEDYVYWSDISQNILTANNKFTGHNQTELARSMYAIYGMAVFHEVLQPRIRNRCLRSPCSHLCMLIPNGFVCGCPEHLHLSNDRSTCIPKSADSFLLIIMDDTIKKIYPEMIGKDVVMEINVPQMINVSTFTYDKVNRTIYLVCRDFGGIWAVNISSLKPKMRLVSNLTEASVETLIYDEHSNNLYILDSRNGVVNVLSTDGRSQMVLVSDLNNAVDLVLDQKHGRMFLALAGKDPHIKMISMDGQNLRRLHIKHLGVPQALFLDKATNQLYFSDSKKGNIEAVVLKNKTSQEEYNTMVLKKGLGLVNSLAVYGDTLYWTNKNNRSLLHAHMLHPTDASIIVPYEHHHPLSAVDKVIVVSTEAISSGCRTNNGGCSHICLLGEGNISCACPVGLNLGLDKKTCVTSRVCRSDEVVCYDNSACILNGYLCDGQDDCLDASDEKYCQNICTTNDFKCDNQKCVPKKWTCDTVNDCGDWSDEKNCTNITCPAGRFACGDGKCVSLDRRCDGKKDCSNNKDEQACTSKQCKGSTNEFKCGGGLCISFDLRCDFQNDCLDGRDEQNCTCPSGHYRCSNFNCIENKHRCDGVFDCDDNSDEENCDDPTKDTLDHLDKTYNTVGSCRSQSCNGGKCVIYNERVQCRCPDGSYGSSCEISGKQSSMNNESTSYWWLILMAVSLLIAMLLFIKFVPFNKVSPLSYCRRGALREVVVSFKKPFNKGDMKVGLVEAEAEAEDEAVKTELGDCDVTINKESDPKENSDFRNPMYGQLIRNDSDKAVNNLRKWPSTESTVSTEGGNTSSSSDLQSLTSNKRKRDGISFFVR